MRIFCNAYEVFQAIRADWFVHGFAANLAFVHAQLNVSLYGMHFVIENLFGIKNRSASIKSQWHSAELNVHSLQKYH